MKKLKKKKDDKSKPVSILAWTFHPLRSNFRQGLFVILAGSLFCAGVYWNFKDIFLSLLSILIYTFSLSSFFFPTDYVLKEDGIAIKGIISKHLYPWSRFRRFIQTKKGIFLSPYLKACTMDEYRGIYLFCNDETSSKALEIIKEKFVFKENEY
ncbi:MAG: hypothetical protein BWY64_03623 [bacterium ADurb.Bin363]|nr:MAG: hypothetical protein BWY64_03623 [bacterium ADurb.Bin363]